MNFFPLHFALILIFIFIPSTYGFTLSMSIDNTTINVLTTYTYQLNFADSTTRSITLYFPSSTDLSSPSLQLFQNSITTALILGSQYSINNVAKSITIPSPSSFQTSMRFKVTNVKNPTSAIQYQFMVIVSPSVSQQTFPTITFRAGSLVSCVWTFDKFTGSSDSTVNIEAILGNKLFSGLNTILIQFPTVYEDSDNKYLTRNSTPILITYSINNTAFSSPVASSISILNSQIEFDIMLTSNLQANQKLIIKITGVQNPQTQNPSGSGFKLSTYDSGAWGVDTITQSVITQLTLLQLSGTFQLLNTIYVNDNYSNPKINLNVAIPFTIFINDILQLTHPSAMSISNTSALQIQFYRGRFYVYFAIDSNQTTSTLKVFKSPLRDDRVTATNPYFKFLFNILAPNSQKPWQFFITLKRNSGAYVKIVCSLQANAKSIDSSKVQLNPVSNQMSISTPYVLDLTISNPISQNGKIMVSFNSDYKIQAGVYQGYIAGSSITSNSSYEFVTKNGLKWISYKIGGSTQTIIPTNTQLKIIYQNSIYNPLYPKTYNFGIQIYYNENDNSLVEYALNFDSVSLTTHNSSRATLNSNDFMVFQQKTIIITYINDVIIPVSSIIKIKLPTDVYSMSFSNIITINSNNITINTFSINNTEKSLQLTVNQGSIINNQSTWLIPITVTMPIITGNYPSIQMTISNTTSNQPLEFIKQGLEIRVKNPSNNLVTEIQPKSNTLINANSSYSLAIKSSVPLNKNFYIYLTVPADITILSTLTCDSSSPGICSKIQRTDINLLKLTIQNSTYTLTNTFQQFNIVFSLFTNRRSSAPSNNWTVETRSMNNGTQGSVSMVNVKSYSFTSSTNVTCVLDPTYNYYKANVQNVVISCTFHNDLIMNDYIELKFTSDSYTRKTNGLALNCPSPSFIQCSVVTQSPTTLTVKVLIINSPTANKNMIRIEINGLMSNANTFYTSSSAQIYALRYDGSDYLIDQGSFYYKINCNENSTIINKKCKTCSVGKCVTCYDGMFLLNNDSCVSSCPSQTQYRTLNNASSSSCEYCVLPCYTCQSTTVCITCANSLDYLLTTNWSCVKTCDTSNGFYVNTVDNPSQKLCDSCLLNCLRCVNDTYTGCLQCASGFVLENGECKSSCADPTTYIYNNMCYKCNVACQTCNGSGSNNCIRCKQFYYIDNGYCVQTCPTNKYKLADGTCGCEGNCSTCTSSSPKFCVSCINSTNFIYNGECLADCPSYTFKNVSTCINCPSNCVQCTSQSICRQCQTGFYFYESKCYFDCNSISYQFDTKDSQCVLCPTGCDRCNDLICLSCLSQYTLVGDRCELACLLTDSCVIQNPIPENILPVPGSISFMIWIVIVSVAKFFVPKLYIPYSIVFFGSVIQYLLVMSSLIYTNDLISTTIIKRLLVVDYSFREQVFVLLIVGLVFNYVLNVIFAWIFCKYIKPLIQNPKQVDYITMTTVGVIGMMTNYRFCLIFFCKMFPKPKIIIDYASRLTPVHYICVSSIVLSIFPLTAGGLMIRNQSELTDIFMLGVDLIIIQLLLLVLSICMIAINKDESYYEQQIKKYHIEEIHKTQQTLQEDKNLSKHNLIRDSFEQKSQLQVNFEDSIHVDKKLLDSINITNPGVLQSDSHQNPLMKISRRFNQIDIQKVKIKSSNKDQNTMDDFDLTGISYVDNNQNINQNLNLNKRNLKKHVSERDEDPGLKNRFKKVAEDSDKKSKGVFEKSDEDIILPQTLDKQKNVMKIHQPQSQDIPNLPLNDSIFHQRSSSEFGLKIKPKLQQQKSQIMKNSKETSPIKKQQNKHRSNMKKKNKFFQSQGFDSQIANDKIQDMDFESIIQSKIIVVKNNDKEGRQFQVNNISGIVKKDDLNSEDHQINEEISPSWFNIQNQRFDFDSGNDVLSDN